jgi:Acetokinase family
MHCASRSWRDLLAPPSLQSAPDAPKPWGQSRVLPGWAAELGQAAIWACPFVQIETRDIVVCALVFTAGIGEHAPEIRRRVCQQAGWLGVYLDGAANTAGAVRITMPDSKASAWAIPTNEDLMIARHTWRLTEDDVTEQN